MIQNAAARSWHMLNLFDVKDGRLIRVEPKPRKVEVRPRAARKPKQPCIKLFSPGQIIRHNCKMIWPQNSCHLLAQGLAPLFPDGIIIGVFVGSDEEPNRDAHKVEIFAQAIDQIAPIALG